MADLVIGSLANASMIDSPLWLQATGGDAAIPYTALDDRTLQDAILAEGCFVDGDLKVVQRAAGANLTVDIGGGKACIKGDSVTRQGKYLVSSTGTVNTGTAGNVTVPGSGTRTHRVIARIRDKVAAGTNYDWTLEVLEDTGSGIPAEPASAITLASLAVPSGSASVTTAMITDLRPWAQGLMGSNTIASGDITQQTPASLILISKTITNAVAGARYRASFGSSVRFTAADNYFFYFRFNAGLTVATTDSFNRRRQQVATVETNNRVWNTEDYITATADGPLTIGFHSERTTGTGTAFWGANSLNTMAFDIYKVS